jgi:hypothetical protein
MTAFADFSSRSRKPLAYIVASIAVLAVIALVGNWMWNGRLGTIRGPLSSLRFTIVDDQREAARSAYSYLQDQGAALSFVGTGELGNLQMTKPDIVIVAAGTHWTRNDPTALKQTFEGYRVIGVGNAGDELFRVLGLQISGAMHSDSGKMIVEEPKVLQTPLTITTSPDRAVAITSAIAP